MAESPLPDTRVQGQVRIIGAGLLGASIGLGLRARGVDVVLVDQSPTHLRLAIDYGAGRAATEHDTNPALIVVAVPPEIVGDTVADALTAFPNALVTDVASVKVEPLERVRALGADVSRYIGSHPMAGRERGGPVSARADLFLARPWVIAGHDGISYRDAGLVEDMILDLGATPVELDVHSHDESVALISHVPQLVSSLMAARLADADDEAVALAGGGVRDVTRIAASQPELWLQILQANTEPVVAVLEAYRHDLDTVIASLSDIDRQGSRSQLVELIEQGNTGVRRLPGKHGSKQRYSTVVVLVEDTPGQLAKLLTQVGEFGINLEDLRLEHSPGAPVGIAELQVLPSKAAELMERLEANGWKISA